MKLRLLRNATLWRSGPDSADRSILCPKGIAAVLYRARAQPNGRPAASPEEILDGVELVVVSHLHADHFDPVAQSMVPKHLPLICQPGDEDRSARSASRT